VDTFDGHTGEQQAVIEPASPIGYRIASLFERTLIIQRVLDNCSTQEQRDAFEPRCVALQLDTLRLADTPCP
jgi:hypothetical protein